MQPIGSPETLAKMRGINDVVSFLADFTSPIHRAVGMMCRPHAQRFAVHGAALAKAIAEFTPDLLAKSEINVLVVADPGDELNDKGRWLQTAALLTGTKFNISVIVPGAGRSVDHNPTPFAAHLKALKGATFLDYGPDKIVSSSKRPDLVALPVPSFADDVLNPSQWEWLLDVTAAGIPVVGWAYDDLERDFAVRFVETMGFAKVKTAESALHVHERVHPSFINVQGRFLFQLLATDEPETPDFDGMMYLAYLALRLSEALREETATPWGGTVIEWNGRELLVDLSGRAVDIDDGQIFDVLVGRRGEPVFSETDFFDEDWEPVSADFLNEMTRLERASIAEESCISAYLDLDEEEDEDEGEDGEEVESLLIQSLGELVRDGTMAKAMHEVLGMVGLDADQADAFISRTFAKNGVEAGIPLFVAAYEDDAAAIVALSKKDGFDPDELDGKGWTALQLTAATGHVGALKALLKAGADVNAIHSMSGKTALDIAMEDGYFDAALLMLKAGAQLDNRPHAHPSARDRLNEGEGSKELLAWYRRQNKNLH
ncbi:ankyrin repeat domain-containing protein [Stenotrophomonas geniculata]|uniref:ankyrin repeat domain-containing protein n=1 Tax=Stenotrophomonas geniculata TaxID=86188 RepID=UPI002E783762|nr:ankyrin repeat domain-containing protein [Stenotrophomonas geniculata]